MVLTETRHEARGCAVDDAGPLPTPASDSGDPGPWIAPSWDDVVRTHASRVYRLAYRLTGNPHDAEDLTQEVFVRVFRSLSSYTPGTFEGWLHRITTNLFLDSARRRQRIRFEGLGPDVAGRLPAATPARPMPSTSVTWTVTSRLRCATSPPNTARPWCCATSRACRTRRSRPPWA